MGRLVYFTIASLDGFVEDSSGSFQWSRPDEAAFEFVNDLVRPVTTHLLGRRMYEVMLYWERYPAENDVATAMEHDFAKRWRSAEKIVYSRSLKAASSERTRIVRRFDPTAVRRLKRESRGDLSVAGATLAGEAIQAGLVDELQLLIAPVVTGGGKSWLPRGVQLDLELIDTRKLGHGFTFLRYRASAPKSPRGRKASRPARRSAT